MTLGEKLQQLRCGRGLSQEALAEQLGVSRQSISKWELDQTVPAPQNIKRLCEIFKVPADELLWGGSHTPAQDRPTAFHYEYTSRIHIGSLPLLHIHLGAFRLCRARGIIAIGNMACGVLAIGIFSVGVAALGALSLGILAAGALALGLLAAGGLAVGLVAAGGLAVGIFSVGGLAVGVYAAGGFAIGSHGAAGGFARGYAAVGDQVRGTLTCRLPGRVPIDQLRGALRAQFPRDPHFLIEWFLYFLK